MILFTTGLMNLKENLLCKQVLAVIFFSQLLTSCRTKVSEQQLQNGERVYIQYCIQCHQADGRGKMGLYPTLRKTPWVNGSAEELVEILFSGVKEPIEVEGISYFKGMSTHFHLSDREIADVATYIRNSFDNRSGPVDSMLVAKVREEITK